MDDVIQIDDEWYYAASSQRADSRSQVLKHGDTFVVLDLLGDIARTGLGEQGLYHNGTRHLSHWEVLIDDRRPMLLNSTMKEDNSVLVVELTTPDVHHGEELVLPKGHLSASRSMVVDGSSLYEHLQLTNYSMQELELDIVYQFGADYRDIFEVRGVKRSKRGELLPCQVDTNAITLKYRGLDDVIRQTDIQFDGNIQELVDSHCRMKVKLAPGEQKVLHATISCQTGEARYPVRSHSQVVQGIDDYFVRSQQTRAQIVTSNEEFNEWIQRSTADLMMLTSETEYGNYPYAGVPWFSTPFGRDGLITALQTLWMEPSLSRGVLAFVAATQATEVDSFCESEPGKIFHEVRRGEMAELGEIPFRRYYGTVDATPLFIILAAYYYRRTGELSFIEQLWPNIERGLEWIDTYGDPDGDGFLEYMRQNDKGLKQQGWKDSDDSIFHADGRDAEGPITLSEVQGYVYEAKILASELAGMLGRTGRSQELTRQAEELKKKFNERFWVERLGTFAIALDGDKRPCEVRNSNVGHLLWSGIVDSRLAPRVAATLLDERSFNGWGIRTIAKGEARYNPMSYHNGSIWPHDTAICAAGLARYGFREECLRIVGGLFDAASYLEWSRLPELFCGFDRLSGHGPTRYPVACSPQAWAAGSLFMLLQSCLGLQFSPAGPQIRVDHPSLPPFLQWVSINNLRVGDAVVDLTLRRHPRDVGLNVDHKEGEIEIVVIA
ncbi:amylo-alpha-1,6-glucosidase [Rubinisphaera margarita]|uniref:amylo-alpha-1,6-glucosidase n=1 Tax=Rubinisphaera margarita TaxID=2909586 RepID=UPI001EE7C856|nr:amylo-alpha-1,6-glucosidase [Rubinisphaera margarita]MCG6156169.1 amylo-alpha-1,6-glucosidase [Rubinisphaera margarita]